jgi:hypothetical protein
VASFLTFLSLLWSFFLANLSLPSLAGAGVAAGVVAVAGVAGALAGSAANAVNANADMMIAISCFILFSFEVNEV